MRMLRPVPEYPAKSSTGTIHIIGMRDYHGEIERALCGHQSGNMDRFDSDEIEPHLDNPSMCKRCTSKYE